MNFKEWSQNVIKIDNSKYLENADISYSVIRTENILKKVYNAFKGTGYIEVSQLYTTDKLKEGEYILGLPYELETDEIFGFIKALHKSQYISEILLDRQFDNILAGDASNNNNFYCLFTIDPNCYSIQYIEKVEEILNKNITRYTNRDLLYKELSKAIKDPMFKSTLMSTIPNFAIWCFDSEKALNEYKEAVRCNAEEDIENEKELLEMINNLTKSTDVSNVKITLKDPNTGEVIDLGKYNKKNNDNNNKLN